MTNEDESTDPGIIVAAERVILKFLRHREAKEAAPEDHGTSTVNQVAEHPVSANPVKQTKTTEGLAAACVVPSRVLCQLNRVAQWHRLAQFHPSMRKNPLQIKRTRYPLCQTGPSLDTVYGAQPVSPNARPRPSRKARPRSDRRRCPNSSSFVSMDGECRMCFRKIIVFSRQT
jgi:hypothetical protein